MARKMWLLVDRAEAESILNDQIGDATDDVSRIEARIGRLETQLTRVVLSLSQGGLSRSERRKLKSKRDDLAETVARLRRDQNAASARIDLARENAGDLPMIQIDERDLSADERSDLGYYWADVRAMLEGRSGNPMSSWAGVRIGGYQVEFDRDTILGMAMSGQLDFDDLYEE
jgi:outer membrane murein-binding lipoprotein Lpp